MVGTAELDSTYEEVPPNASGTASAPFDFDAKWIQPQPRKARNYSRNPIFRQKGRPAELPQEENEDLARLAAEYTLKLEALNRSLKPSHFKA